MKAHTCRADLHVHSRHSQLPSSWILKKIGCFESYTEPASLYRTLKHRGMDLVTITDHNSIEGCLEIAHLQGAFISEEITTAFPDDNCKLHVLAYNISEQQHEEIARLRENVFELVDFLNTECIVHALAHPMYSVNGLLRVEHFQKLLLLFSCLELNGARDPLQNTIIQRICSTLSQGKIEELAHCYNITPRGECPWKKSFISGSDDHSSLYLGTSYTTIVEASSAEAYLEGISRRQQSIQTHQSGPQTLAHNIYSVIFQFYDETYQLGRWIDDPTLVAFLNEVLLPPDRRPDSSRKSGPPNVTKASFGLIGSSFPERFLETAKQFIHSSSGADASRNRTVNPQDQMETWQRFVEQLTDSLTRQCIDDILLKLAKADIFAFFPALGSLTSLYTVLSPYFIAYSLFARDRTFSLQCLEKHDELSADLSGPPRNIALFTDTFHEINGVATSIRTQADAARLTEKHLTVIHCGSSAESSSKVAAFHPIGAFDLPEYPELKLYYPPILNIVSYCYRMRFTHIQAETPGTMGLTALLISHILNLPFRGAYHTSLPQTIGAVMDDSHIEALLWKYVLWFYGQMERIYVPSAKTADELVRRGLPKEKIRLRQTGVHLADFHPEKRNGYFNTQYNIDESHTKITYVGRVSKEKNLHIFQTIL
ncbi:MAG: glycosyltransferase, partial [Desulfohalobiaceae bacterium]|nr:glycosyltransferase [Desulfohalobiaceae bacterium]